jgi:adenylylsulfate kinase
MQKRGLVIWLTGLSGAGKTTLARAISRELAGNGLPVETLDGDEVRETLSRGLGFSREDRDTNVRRIGFVARLLARNGVIVLASVISPYQQARDDVRRMVEDDGARFVEIFVRCPLGVLIERDVKGLYKKALAGEIAHFTGVSDPYEAPASPDLAVDSSAESVEQGARKIISHLSKIGALESEAVPLPEAIAPIGRCESAL